MFLESALEELHSPSTRPERIAALQHYLCGVQQSLTLPDLDECLRSERPHSTAFALHAVAARPGDFCAALPKLLAFFKAMLSCRTSDNSIIRTSADSIAAIVLSLPRDDLAMAMVMDLLDQREFLVLECLSSRIHRLVQNEKSEQARIHWCRTMLKDVVPRMMLDINADFDAAVSAAKEYALIADASEMQHVLGALFSAAPAGKECRLADVLSQCAESCPLRRVIHWYLLLLNGPASSLAVQPALAVFQDKMIDFCELPERIHICNLALDHLGRSPPCELEMTVGFWEELATDLSDSDGVMPPDKEVFKRLLEVAFSTSIAPDSAQSLAQAAYKVIGQDLVHHLIDSYTASKASIYASILISLGREYVGPVEPVKALIRLTLSTNPALCLDLCAAFHSALRDNVEVGRAVCSLATSSLLQNPCPDTAVLVSECLALYAKHASPDKLFSCLNALLSFHDNRLDDHLQRFLIAACEDKDQQTCNQVTDFLCRHCPSLERLSMVEALVADSSFQFSPRDCPGFGDLIHRCIVHCLDADPNIGEKCVQFLACAAARIAAVDPQACARWLSDLKRQVRSPVIVPVFTSAEQVAHFEDSVALLQTYEGEQVSLEMLQLHAAVCGTNYEAYMEYGIDHAADTLRCCLARLQEPLDKGDLAVCLNYLTSLFLHHQREAHKNWAELLFSATKAACMDALLQASSKYDSDKMQAVACFLHSLAAEYPVQLKEYIDAAHSKSRVSWMLQHRSLKEFCILFQKTFQ